LELKNRTQLIKFCTTSFKVNWEFEKCEFPLIGFIVG